MVKTRTAGRAPSGKGWVREARRDNRMLVFCINVLPSDFNCFSLLFNKNNSFKSLCTQPLEQL